jgi:hypothetical protein
MLGGPQGRSGQVRKISPPPGFDPRTVQPVASRFTDCVTRPTNKHMRMTKLHVAMGSLGFNSVFQNSSLLVTVNFACNMT